MNYLDILRAAGLEVNWRTIAVGWDGPGKWSRLLTVEDVQGFAESCLAAAPAPGTEVALLAIIASSADEMAGVGRQIRTLADASRADASQELRKWRVILLKDQLWKLPRDPLYGLIALTEFWEKFDYPGDGPHVVQGRGSAVAPEKYYSEENFRAALRKHVNWAEGEVRALGGLDG